MLELNNIIIHYNLQYLQPLKKYLKVNITQAKDYQSILQSSGKDRCTFNAAVYIENLCRIIQFLLPSSFDFLRFSVYLLSQNCDFLRITINCLKKLCKQYD